jgi:virginiamycin B lyase
VLTFGRVDTATGAMKEFVIPNEGARPRRIQVSPNGMVYYTDYARGYLGQLDSGTGQFKEWKSPGVSGVQFPPWTLRVGR